MTRRVWFGSVIAAIAARSIRWRNLFRRKGKIAFVDGHWHIDCTDCDWPCVDIDTNGDVRLAGHLVERVQPWPPLPFERDMPVHPDAEGWEYQPRSERARTKAGERYRA